MDRELILRGVGEVRVMPDLASVRVSVAGDGQSQDEAYQLASVSAAAVDVVLADFEPAIDRVITDGLAVQPKTRWRKGESQQTGWKAFRTSVVEVTGTSRVSELLSALAGAGASISSLSWTVAPGNESFALARQRAGEDATARAEQYARALGVRLGGVAWAAEPGLRSPGQMDWTGLPTNAALAASAGNAEEPISVNADEVTIHAVLEVGYTIAQDANLPNG